MQRHRGWRLLLGSIAAAVVLTPGMARAVPDTITFAAYLDDSGVPLEGPHDFDFAIYVALPPNPMIWGESHGGVIVTDGMVDVELGSVTSLAGTFAGVPLELEVTVDGVPLSPRLEITSVPYALHAAVADTATAASTLAGLGGDDYQRRVAGGCIGSSGIRAINSDGSVECGSFLGSVDCPAGQVLASDGPGSWSCHAGPPAGSCPPSEVVVGFDAVTGLPSCAAVDVPAGSVTGTDLAVDSVGMGAAALPMGHGFQVETNIQSVQHVIFPAGAQLVLLSSPTGGRCLVNATVTVVPEDGQSSSSLFGSIVVKEDGVDTIDQDSTAVSHFRFYSEIGYVNQVIVSTTSTALVPVAAGKVYSFGCHAHLKVDTMAKMQCQLTYLCQ